MRQGLKFFIASVFILIQSGLGKQDFSKVSLSGNWLLGAHYYLWYPENFDHGFLREALLPSEEPLLGRYSSADKEVIEQHISWCAEYGIDFLAIDYWPTRKEHFERLTSSFLAASNIGDIKFCIFFETWTLNFAPLSGTIHFDNKVIKKLVDSVTKLIPVFRNPSYLKIGGKPVLFLYLTRTYTGDYDKAIRVLRDALKNQGLDLFLVGDEVFWDVVYKKWRPRPRYELDSQPHRKRIKLFDAVTGYNLYESRNRSHAGYGSESTFIRDVSGLFHKYIKVCHSEGVKFIPNVIPGYNDRGTRPAENHYVIPRQWSASDEEGSFFSHCLQTIGIPFLDPGLNMLLVTSFNEWNEDTSIEPLEYEAKTINDISHQNNYFTQGFAYEGFGFKYLEIIRDHFTVFHGRLTDANGNPVRGESVSLWKGKKKISSASSDSNGRYRFSKNGVDPGEYELGVYGKMLKVIAKETSQEINVSIPK